MSIIEKALDKLDSSQPKSHRRPAPAVVDVDSRAASDGDASVRAGAEPRARETKPRKRPVTHKHIDLDFPTLAKRGFVTPDSGNRLLTEQYRRIKRPLLLNAFGTGATAVDNRNMVMITSALEGEGKTFSSLNLAMSVADEFNHTVLLVDGDVSKRSLSRTVGISDDEPGLMDVLEDPSLNLSDVLFKTNIPKLLILPPGKTHGRVTELLSSKRMREFAGELSGRYDDRLVIFDTPPLLQDSSAASFASLVSQILIVVEAEKTPQHVVQEAMRVVAGCKSVALMLNKSNQRFSSDYGYGYY